MRSWSWRSTARQHRWPPKKSWVVAAVHGPAIPAAATADASVIGGVRGGSDAGAVAAAQEGRQEQERSQRHVGGDVHLASGPGRSVARPLQQEGVRDLRHAARGDELARCQATRRGFPPKTPKTVQIVIDGEKCLEQQLRQLFPGAILTLDIRHAQEKLWEVGRLFHREGSPELTCWVEELEELLYKGHVQTLLRRLEPAFRGVSSRGPGTKQKQETLKRVIEYLRSRVKLMDYGRWRAGDLVIASGVVEGAARYVVGERLDQSGMRWVEERAEAVLLLRCIEVNGDWEDFVKWGQAQS